MEALLHTVLRDSRVWTLLLGPIWQIESQHDIFLPKERKEKTKKKSEVKGI